MGEEEEQVKKVTVTVVEDSKEAQKLRMSGSNYFDFQEDTKREQERRKKRREKNRGEERKHSVEKTAGRGSWKKRKITEKQPQGQGRDFKTTTRECRCIF